MKSGTRLKKPFRLIPPKTEGIYFLQQKDNEFVHSGAAIFDSTCGGGIGVLGKMTNLIGDKSTGKTLLALEACINFHKQYPKGKGRYVEPEAALSKGYAKELGVDKKWLQFAEDDADIDTVEDLYDDLNLFIDDCREEDVPGIYVVDSWDALDDEAEKGKGIREGTYGGSKPKQTGRLFRKLIRKLKQSRVCLIIVSQTKEAIGAGFGEKYRRSGGKALDYYASIIVWLAHMGQTHTTISGVKRTTGIQIRARQTKTKVGIQFRECTLDIEYGFGVDDVASNLRYLASVGKAGMVKIGLGNDPGKITHFLKQVKDGPDREYTRIKEKLDRITPEVWRDVEKAFLPTRRKYR